MEFAIRSSDGARFWLYEQPNNDPNCCSDVVIEAGGRTFHSNEEAAAAGVRSMDGYSATLNAVTLPPGSSLVSLWWVWLQPSPPSTLVLGGFFGGLSVHLEGSRIRPLVFIPGILGTMPPDYAAGSMEPILRTYEPLLTNLQLRGYELDKSLFIFPVDWRDSIDVVAGHLADSLPEFLQTAKQTRYVGEPTGGGPARKADLVVHSMGGLITRAYVEGDNYHDDVGKAVFIGTPHRGYPEAYRTREGLTWDAYLADNLYEAALGKVLDTILWPVLVGKRYGPSEAEMQAAGCASLGFISCPRSARYDWSHDPVKGVFSLLEMLPDESTAPYLVCGDATGAACTPLSSYPFGRQTNPLLDGPDGLNSPGRLLKLADRLGPKNIMTIFGSESPTSVEYLVRPGGPPLWAQGEPIGRVIGDGDGLVPSDSANLGLLMPQLPAENVVKLTGPDARHKPITYHRDVQMLHLPLFLTGTAFSPDQGTFPPFNAGLPATEYDPFPPSIDLAKTLIFWAQCPVNLTVTDTRGRRVGFDPDTGGSLQEIADAVYAAPGAEGQFIIIPDAENGSYQLRASAFADGAYVLSAGRLGADGLTTLGTFSGNVSLGQVLAFEVDAQAPPGPSPTPLDALHSLIQDVRAYARDGEIKRRLARGLLGELRKAGARLRHESERAAARQLKVFVHRIERRRGNRISDAAAGDLIAKAKAIIGQLGGGSSGRGDDDDDHDDEDD